MSTQQFSSAGVDPATGPGRKGDCGWRTAFPTMASKSSLFSDIVPRGFRNNDVFQKFIRLQITMSVFFNSFTLIITTSRHLLTSQCLAPICRALDMGLDVNCNDPVHQDPWPRPQTSDLPSREPHELELGTGVKLHILPTHR